MKLLAERVAEITYYDPYVPVIKPARDYSQFAGRKSVAWNRATIENFDLVLIATNHSSVNHHELGEWARCIVDTRNAMADIPVSRGKVWKRNQGHRGLYGFDRHS
jgi:UDP-N-acetyl-D-glucosamine dehydrogenase